MTTFRSRVRKNLALTTKPLKTKKSADWVEISCHQQMERCFLNQRFEGGVMRGGVGVDGGRKEADKKYQLATISGQPP